MTLEQCLIEKMKVPDLVGACRKLAMKRFWSLRTFQGSVDVVELARQAGIRVKLENSIAFDGSLSWDENGKATIVVSSRINSVRRRFTIAHELGHWLLQMELLGKRSEPLFRGLSRNRPALNEEERICNQIAAEILLPFEPVQLMLNSRQLTMSLIRCVAHAFQASPKAVIRRVAEVTNHTLIYLNVVPYRFQELASPAEVDEAIYAFPGGGIRFDRSRTRLVGKVPYSNITDGVTNSVEIVGSRGRWKIAFKAVSSTFPIPNADLLASSCSAVSAEAKHHSGARLAYHHA